MARYIDADDFLDLFYVAAMGQDQEFIKTVEMVLDDTPTADVVEVVRCKYCKWYQLYHLACIHPYFNGWINVDGFCSYGEKRDAE